MEEKGNKSQRRGLAVMNPEQRKEIARQSGQTAQRLGKAHVFTTAEARKGGERGGRTVSQNRAYMSEIGRRGAVSPRRQRAKVKD